jgi:hypothetical protein
MTALPTFRAYRGTVVFASVAAAMFAIDTLIARSSAIDVRPDLIGAAIAFDLTIGVLFVYWLLLVRPGRVPAHSMLAVFAVSAMAATLVLGSNHLDGWRLVRYFGIPMELAVLGLVAAKIHQSARRQTDGLALDVPERIRVALGGAQASSAAVGIVAMELSIFFYALASWRRKPFVPPGARGFAYHKKNGYAGLLYTIVRIALVEAVAVDFIIRVKHPVAANVFLALDVLTALWVLGLARSVVLRPILVTRDEILVRNGLHWRLDIPRANIERITFDRVTAPAKGTAGHLRPAPGRPNVLIELRAPMRAQGPYGISRMVRQVSLALDDVAGFQSALSSS